MSNTACFNRRAQRKSSSGGSSTSVRSEQNKNSPPPKPQRDNNLRRTETVDDSSNTARNTILQLVSDSCSAIGALSASEYNDGEDAEKSTDIKEDRTEDSVTDDQECRRSSDDVADGGNKSTPLRNGRDDEGVRNGKVKGKDSSEHSSYGVIEQSVDSASISISGITSLTHSMLSLLSARDDVTVSHICNVFKIYAERDTRIKEAVIRSILTIDNGFIPNQHLYDIGMKLLNVIKTMDDELDDTSDDLEEYLPTEISAFITLRKVDVIRVLRILYNSTYAKLFTFEEESYFMSCVMFRNVTYDTLILVKDVLSHMLL